MTSSTTPQDRAAQFAKFIPTSDASPQELADEISAYLLEGWSCPPEAQRMLARAAVLLSSGTQEEGDGSLRSEPSAAGQVQWAALPPYHSSIHDDRESAVASVAFVRECGDECSLYEIREVPSG